ncbi:hypothetical protein M413DRAFT_135889 [Hebeloma cylindrosporum]|uniref:Uncharacterized protein n=1 Tax=Hebeloma cylindrosporum TaxID=76867 RepID=A0A0C3BYK9_HEBCY|nr:hypothetical protein M413DRAFT_135889 [Hebeloma cylindrosporum h7]
MGTWCLQLPPYWDGSLVESLTETTALELDAGDVPASAAISGQIFPVADALARSLFPRFIENSVLYCSERAKKLKRRLEKACYYNAGISYLLKKAKRLFPIPHRWDTFTGRDEGEFNLCDNIHDALPGGSGCTSLDPETVKRVDTFFPSMFGNWRRQQKVHTCLRAELRVVLHLGLLPGAIDPADKPIGASKRSCLWCGS